MSYLKEAYLAAEHNHSLTSEMDSASIISEYLSISLRYTPEVPDDDDSGKSTFVSLGELQNKSHSESEEKVTTKGQLECFGLKPLELTVTRNESDEDALTDEDPQLMTTLSSALSKIAYDSDLVISQLLGAGGMGIVFDGLQKCLNREVAFKISKNYQNLNSILLAQICHEAQITARLSHARIPPVYLLAITPKGEPVQVMKKIEGVSWNVLLKNVEDPFWNQLGMNFSVQCDMKEHPYIGSIEHKEHLYFNLNTLVHVSQAMAYTHHQDVIHRDLKPENIMIGPYGEVHILDWGVAIDLNIVSQPYSPSVPQKVSTIENVLIGTPSYMPPEMALKEIDQQGPWTDVFQLGAMLYQIWTGDLLYAWDPQKREEIFKDIERARIPTLPESMPIEVSSLLLDALHADPKQRIADAQDFADRLSQLIQTFESRDMEYRGRQVLAQTQALMASSLHSRDAVTYNDEVDQRLDETRYFFWSATQLWPENESAQQGLDEVLQLWIPILVARNELSCAERLLRSIPRPTEELMEVWRGIPERKTYLQVEFESTFQKKWSLLMGAFVVSTLIAITSVSYIILAR